MNCTIEEEVEGANLRAEVVDQLHRIGYRVQTTAQRNPSVEAVEDELAALVAEIAKLPRGARAAVADFFEAGSQPPIRSTAVLLAFVGLIRAVGDHLAELDAREVIAETQEEAREYQVNP